MKQRRFKISSKRDYKIEVFDCKGKLITTIKDSGYYNMQQILNEAKSKSMGARAPKSISISCQETEESGIYTMNGKKML